MAEAKGFVWATPRRRRIVKASIRVGIWSMVGGLVVHLALTACGSGQSANASPTSCNAWQVTVENGSGNPYVITPGWEPFAWIPGNNGYPDQIAVRRCAP